MCENWGYWDLSRHVKTTVSRQRCHVLRSWEGNLMRNSAKISTTCMEDSHGKSVCYYNLQRPKGTSGQRIVYMQKNENFTMCEDQEMMCYIQRDRQTVLHVLLLWGSGTRSPCIGPATKPTAVCQCLTDLLTVSFYLSAGPKDYVQETVLQELNYWFLIHLLRRQLSQAKQNVTTCSKCWVVSVLSVCVVTDLSMRAFALRNFCQIQDFLEPFLHCRSFVCMVDC